MEEISSFENHYKHLWINLATKTMMCLESDVFLRCEHNKLNYIHHHCTVEAGWRVKDGGLDFRDGYQHMGT